MPISGFDASCFDGVYVTGDITTDDIQRMRDNRPVEQESGGENSRLALPNAEPA